MVYIQQAGGGSDVTVERSQRKSSLVDERRPTAWTVLPLAVPHDNTPTRQHAPRSHSTRSSRKTCTEFVLLFVACHASMHPVGSNSSLQSVSITVFHFVCVLNETDNLIGYIIYCTCR